MNIDLPIHRITRVVVTTLLLTFSPATANEQRVLFLIGEREYDTRQTLPEFAERHLEPARFDCDFVFAASDDRQRRECHQFPGLHDALDRADLLVISVRRRLLPQQDLDAVRQFIELGKPVVGIRTASHAFAAKSTTDQQISGGGDTWSTFDRDVFGATYEGHYPGKDTVLIRSAIESRASRLLNGIATMGTRQVTSSLYRNRNLDGDTRVLLWGSVAGRPETLQPVAWTYVKAGRRAFYTSLGSASDMRTDWVPRLLKNGVAWALSERSDVGSDSEADATFEIRPNDADGEPRSPDDSHATIVTPKDLAVDLLASEPSVTQPSFINFDERGRMWVVQYRQYPEPAGLTIVSHDRYWRSQYDRVPAPPGHPDHIAGKDQITIHEDTDGDGTFDHVKTFVDGLSLVTACERGLGGVWVLNPPYLLFYPDEDDNDLPDGPPVVHLEGFGIQDTHSIAAGLCWGPDGWLYGCHGSTVASAVKVRGTEQPPLSSIGQMIWRYHPLHKRYEVYAEGGGNIWSCEIDSAGRVFAGSNDLSPAFFYLQGAYYRKNFGKHGDLSNPYAFEHLNGIDHPDFKRVSCSIVLYEGGTLPPRYQGAIIGCNPTQGVTVASQIQRDGLNYVGKYIDVLATNEDRWFRPVYPAFGPDGAVYVGDWYDAQVNHWRSYQGRISKRDGRLFRIRSQNAQPLPPFDLRQASNHELVDALGYRNRWWRETARRLLRDRSDQAEVIPRLKEMLSAESGQLALEALWALHLCESLDDRVWQIAATHPNPQVRTWAVRLIGDRRQATQAEAETLLDLAQGEIDAEVCGQLASSAKRLPNSLGISLVEALLARPSTPLSDPMKMLCWWALEAHCEKDAERIVRICEENGAFWKSDFVQQKLGGFLMRRLAADGRQEWLQYCARLLRSAPNEVARSAMIDAFEEAYRGRAMVGVPASLTIELAAGSGAPLSLRLRLGKTDSVSAARDLLQDPGGDATQKIRVLEVMSEQRFEEVVPLILAQLHNENDDVRLAALYALPNYDDAAIGPAVVRIYASLQGDLRAAARSVLASRLPWSHNWLDAVDRGELAPEQIPADAVAQMRAYRNDALNARLDKVFGGESLAQRAQYEAEIARIQGIVAQPGGNPQRGFHLFRRACATCHTLFGKGGAVGPDLTSYQRNRLNNLLTAIVHPSAEIREGFATHVVLTVDGRLLTGFIKQEDGQLLTLQTTGGNALVLNRDAIEEVTPNQKSIMPDQLLSKLTDQELLDLFSYLRSAQPLNLN